jgi:cation transport ATPase
MVVASMLDGRVRIRDEGLKREPLASRVKEELLATPGVSSVEANTRVGSLLVLYSAALTAAEKILKTVAQLLGSEAETSASEQPAQGEQSSGSWKLPLPWRTPHAERSVLKRRVLNNIGMLASLTFSLVAAIFHLKKLHILTGIIFLALFGDHFYQRRARMFA